MPQIEQEGPLPRAGDLAVDLEVAGLRLRLRAFPVAEQPFLPSHYPGFYRLDESAPADLVLDCSVGDERLVLPLPPPAEAPPVSVEESEPGCLVTRGNWHEATVDLTAGRGEVRFHSLRPLPFRMSLENVLRVACANLLLGRGACLLHAAALVTDDGRADVFFGTSGSGKSRLVQCCPGRAALSDDLIALRLRARGVLAADRVPFHGAFPPASRTAGTHEVRRLASLRSGATTGRRPLSAPRAAARLRACMPFLRGDDARALALAVRMVGATSVDELTLAPDGDVRSLVV